MNKHETGRGLRLAIICTIGLLAAGTAFAQGSASHKNMLWRVESGGNVVYLLGSVHILPKSMYPLSPVIERAFDSAEKVTFEINLDSVNQASNATSLIAKGMFNDGRTLKKVLSKSTYHLAERRLKKEGYDIAMFNQFKPWVVAFMLTSVEGTKEGFDPQYGIDFYFHRKADSAGKPVLGLETIDDQLNVFATMPEQTQEEFLRQMLTNADADKEMDIILDAWKKGEPSALEELLRRYTSNDTLLYEAMLFRRNRNWIPIIEGYLHDPDTHRYLVVVGSLHLVGNRGVVEMLRSKGYKVEQM
jgi:uncharacterized protein YbaP (TraB family)